MLLALFALKISFLFSMLKYLFNLVSSRKLFENFQSKQICYSLFCRFRLKHFDTAHARGETTDEILEIVSMHFPFCRSPPPSPPSPFFIRCSRGDPSTPSHRAPRLFAIVRDYVLYVRARFVDRRRDDSTMTTLTGRRARTYGRNTLARAVLQNEPRLVTRVQ